MLGFCLTTVTNIHLLVSMWCCSRSFQTPPFLQLFCLPLGSSTSPWHRLLVSSNPQNDLHKGTIREKGPTRGCSQPSNFSLLIPGAGKGLRLLYTTAAEPSAHCLGFSSQKSKITVCILMPFLPLQNCIRPPPQSSCFPVKSTGATSSWDHLRQAQLQHICIRGQRAFRQL